MANGKDTKLLKREAACLIKQFQEAKAEHLIQDSIKFLPMLAQNALNQFQMSCKIKSASVIPDQHSVRLNPPLNQ